jgi:hypothetical protein
MRAQAATGVISAVALVAGLIAGLMLGGNIGARSAAPEVDEVAAPVEAYAPKRHEAVKPQLEPTPIATHK